MTNCRSYDSWPDKSQQTILQLLAQIIAEMRTHAEVLDREPQFPEDDFARLRSVGALSAVMPSKSGGLGFGVEADAAPALFESLRMLGSGNLAVGRIFEGHVNAFKLVMLYGDGAQKAQAIDDVRCGHLFAIWVADGSDPVRLIDDPYLKLAGRKVFCSAAGYATRALITARARDGIRMLLVPVQAVNDQTLPRYALHGMKASVTSSFSFDDLPVKRDALVGCIGDYTREPAFSAGAWRTTAVTLGGLDALIDETRKQLVARGRHTDPHQLARMGRAFVAQETVQLWVRKAAIIAESAADASASVTAYVNLTRTAIEAAVLDTIQIIQRCLGLAAFLAPNPVERLIRDLGTYLRQPAPDEALTEASAWRFEHDFPES